MSRSYRKPIVTDGYKGSRRKQFHKNCANRRIRRTVEEIANGKAYRKFYESWDICDYKWRCNFEPYVYRNWKTKELEWVYPADADRSWRVCRK